ncbi:hypothetical protein G3567_04850 [Psychroflexus sp. YR1-1]|uniref:tRNA modification GTPase n=1 Tax=Psychroflexus aurantiacus TaxID=2709310 RepID=A0A6B3QZ62_9FLAO|nr:hypothetical protein [Psychroflexus aurantiacus]NEV93479.1 hypothetical protein [Psychroflexus aurantiacus]
MNYNPRFLSYTIPFFFFLCSFMSIAQSQSAYVSGYFITEDNSKVECLIYNRDWGQNPEEITYKMDEDSKTQTATLEDITEFKLDNTEHYYKRFKLNSDLVSYEDSKTIKQKGEAVFIKVLIDSETKLYSYKKSGERFFFFGDEKPVLLRYDKTINDKGKAIKSRAFQKQLYDELNCVKFKISRYSKLEYTAKDLISLFKDYYRCNDYNFETTYTRRTRFKYDFKLISGLNFLSDVSTSYEFTYNYDKPAPPSSGNVSIPVSGESSERIHYKTKLNYIVGFENELFLPIQRNKWSLFFAPNYQHYSGETSSYRLDEDFLTSRTLPEFEFEFSSLELPLGIRYYSRWNENFKLFGHVAVSFNYLIESNFEENFELDLLSENIGIVLSPANQFGMTSSIFLGFGANYQDKYSISLNYYLDRSFGEENFYEHEASGAISLILSYKLF